VRLVIFYTEVEIGVGSVESAAPKSFTLQLEHASITTVSCDPSEAVLSDGDVTKVV